MSRLYLLLNLLSIAIFVSCNNSSTDSYNLNSGQNPTTIARINDSIDNNFNNFIEVFSSDSVFQARRIKFPLKTIRRAMNNESDTIVYIEKSGVEMMDFRKKKTSNGYEEWEENIIIDENNNKATIEINGIDNGIMVDYKFEKINEKWILVEIYDGST